MEIVEKQEKAYKFVENSIIINKKISHAYLIETNGYENYNDFVKYLIKKILCSNIIEQEIINKIELAVNNDNYPDIKYIYPDGNYIKKEQLISLEQEFSKKSMLDNKLIYVIDNAEKLNDSSANTILKFLEEPEDDIVAILVANNRYKVIETIISRCQIISLNNNSIDYNIDDNIIGFFKDLLETKKLIINYDLYLEQLFSNKKEASSNLDVMEMIFYNYLNKYKIPNDIELLLSKVNNEKIINYILLINKGKNKLDYNLNIKIWIMDFIVSLMEV